MSRLDSSHNLRRRQECEVRMREVLTLLSSNPEMSGAAAAREIGVSPNTVTSWARKNPEFGEQYRQALTERHSSYEREKLAIAEAPGTVAIMDDMAAAKETFLRVFEDSGELATACEAAGRTVRTVNSWRLSSHSSFDREFAKAYDEIDRVRLDAIQERVLRISAGVQGDEGNTAKTAVQVLRYRHPDWMEQRRVSGSVRVDHHLTPLIAKEEREANRVLFSTTSRDVRNRLTG